VRVVAIEARHQAAVHAVVLGQRELRTYLEVAPVAEVGRLSREERVACTAVETVTLGARDAGRRVRAAPEIVHASLPGVALETHAGAFGGGAGAGKGLEVPDVLPTPGLGMRGARPVTGLAAAEGLGTRLVRERGRVRGLVVGFGRLCVARDAHLLSGIAGRDSRRGLRLLRLRECRGGERKDQPHDGERSWSSARHHAAMAVSIRALCIDRYDPALRV
jgi:hypothetical protein